MKKSIPITNLKPEPSMSDKAKAVFVKSSGAKAPYKKPKGKK